MDSQRVHPATAAASSQDEHACDCASEGLHVVMRGLERSAVCLHHEQCREDSYDEALDTLLFNICGPHTDSAIVEHVVRNLRFAKTTTVSTPSCGAGKFLTTLLPIIDAALKIKNREARAHNSAQPARYSWPLLRPTILIVEPDHRSGDHTSNLLENLITKYDLDLQVVSFIDDDPRRFSYQREEWLSGDITVCTPRHARSLLNWRDLTLDSTRLSLWNSADQLFGRFYGRSVGPADAQSFLDAYALFAAAKRSEYGMGFILAAQNANSDLLATISARMPQTSAITSSISIAVPVSPRHHANNAEVDVCVWESETTSRSLNHDQETTQQSPTPYAGRADDGIDGGEASTQQHPYQPPDTTTSSSSILGQIELHLDEDIDAVVDAWEHDVLERFAPEVTSLPPAIDADASVAPPATSSPASGNTTSDPTAPNNAIPTDDPTAADGPAVTIPRPLPTPVTTPQHQSATTVPGLMRLPYEIRRRIYSYVVTDEDPIEITTFKTRSTSWPSTSARVSGQVRDRWNYQWYAIRKGAVDWAGLQYFRHEFHLAKVNKQLALEVSPLIYWCNTFSFDNVSDMNTFLLEIDWKRACLRKIRIEDPCGWNTGIHDYGRILFRLWTATNLESIKVNCHCVGSITSPGGNRIQIDTFMKHILPFLRHWHEVNGSSSSSAPVLDLVRFMDDPQCMNCRAKSRVCRLHSGITKNGVRTNFRRLVSRELGLGHL